MRQLFVGLVLAFGTLASSAEAQVVLKLASNANWADPPVVGDQVAFEWLQDEVEGRTGGEVMIEIYWGGSLGSEASLIQTLETGGIDILPNSGSNIAAVIPEIGLFSASYLFRDFDHYKDVVSDPAFFERLQQIVEDHDLGYSLVGIGATGSRNLYNRVREVNSPDEAAGLKMRVQASPVEYRVWTALGMLPNEIASTEIYMALQTGVVDAAESSIPFIVSNRYYEVAPYITLTNHQISSHFYFLGDQALEKVPEEHRATVLEALRETGNMHVDATKRLSAEMLDRLRAQPGVTVTEVEPGVFAEKMSSIQEDVAAELGVEDLLEMIRSH